jgi:hypothetical protein
MLQKYKVYSLDVWGNARDGYEVNDRCGIGEIEIWVAPKALGWNTETMGTVYGFDPTDKQIKSALVYAGYLSHLAEIEIDGESDYALSVDNAIGCPLFQLERVKQCG